MPNARHSHQVDIMDDAIVIQEQIVLQEQPETVPVRLLKNLTVKVRGGVTGKEYIFSGAGSIVDVDKSDIDSINKKNIIRQSCCGSYSSPYFEIL